jgi:hypothetical protein
MLCLRSFDYGVRRSTVVDVKSETLRGREYLLKDMETGNQYTVDYLFLLENKILGVNFIGGNYLFLTTPDDYFLSIIKYFKPISKQYMQLDSFTKCNVTPKGKELNIMFNRNLSLSCRLLESNVDGSLGVFLNSWQSAGCCTFIGDYFFGSLPTESVGLNVICFNDYTITIFDFLMLILQTFPELINNDSIRFYNFRALGKQNVFDVPLTKGFKRIFTKHKILEV